MTAVDTNVLIYAHDQRDHRKMRIAEHLIESLDDGVLLWQVACEYLWASRRLASQKYLYEDALADVQNLRQGWKSELPTWEVMDRALLFRSKGFSHWDALLVSACIEAGVHTLFSEDFRETKRVESLVIVNPFEIAKE
jgi:predicted nucleic acid-binding protein